jgi:hypothetical protein
MPTLPLAVTTAERRILHATLGMATPGFGAAAAIRDNGDRPLAGCRT